MNIIETFSYDDLLIEPKLSYTKSRKDIHLKTKLTKMITLNSPIISSPMDTITEDHMAIQMAIHGGIGIIHRYNTIEEQVKMIQNVKRYIGFIIKNPYTIHYNASMMDLQKLILKYGIYSYLVTNENNELLGIITKRDIERFLIINKEYDNTPVNNVMTEYDKLCTAQNDITREVAIKIMIDAKIEKLPVITNDKKIDGLILFRNLFEYEKYNKYYSLDKSGKLLVGAAVGIIGDYVERTKALVSAECDIICIDVANGHNENVAKCINQLKQIYPEIQIMAGNVCTAEGFEYLCKAGVDCIRVGIGNGSICTTRLVTGIGKGQASAVYECRKIAKKYNVGLIADGGHAGKIGNMAKALILGADAVMLGGNLSGTIETPGKVIIRNSKKVKIFRGMASNMANFAKHEKLGIEYLNETNEEGVNTEIELKGSVKEVLLRIISGIKSSFSYIGCNSFDELRSTENNIQFMRQTSIGFTNETNIRVKVI
jgi:IMP dehydrogenase